MIHTKYYSFVLLYAFVLLAKLWKLSGSFNGYNNKIDAYSGTMYFPYERPFSIDASTDKT